MAFPSVAAYQKLRDQVKQTLLLGQQKIEALKVQTYWQTGKLIEFYLRREIAAGASHAGRDTEVVLKLARDLDISESVLYRCVKFFQCFPKVADRPLSWSHYRALITLQNDQDRKSLLNQALREEWPSPKLEARVREVNQRAYSSSASSRARAKSPSDKELLKSLRGTPYTYRIKKTARDLAIDLGFKIYRSLAAETSKVFEPGILVELAGEGKSLELVKSQRSEKDLFTYRARIEKVIDGDTLKVEIDLGFDTTIRETLRLRGLDCPELDTPEGKGAKKFVESALAGVEWITITSSRSDKYDRYLADVYFTPEKNLKISSGVEQFLNNLLIEHGHAVIAKD